MSKVAERQEVFDTCYRGRQSALHHVAYLRLCKVFAALTILKMNRIELDSKKICDFGFGAGTFFRFCPKDAHLSGIEMDPVTVEEVGDMLKSRGYEKVHLEAIPPSGDPFDAAILQGAKFDVLLCSHVLEHLEDPSECLGKLRSLCAKDGSIVAIVPINEKVANPHHIHVVDRDLLVKWSGGAGLKVVDYQELDAFGYWLQPILASSNKSGRLAAQGISLILGVLSSLIGLTAWDKLSAALIRSGAAKASQAVALLRSSDESATPFS